MYILEEHPSTGGQALYHREDDSWFLLAEQVPSRHWARVGKLAHQAFLSALDSVKDVPIEAFNCRYHPISERQALLILFGCSN